MEAVEELVHVRVPDRTIELRVHGVSGTPPEVLLGGFPVRVAGDADAGFHRVRGADAAGGIAEAFSWGGLTSRTRVTALWLLLAPLALVNVAGWMIPAPSSRERPVGAERVRGVTMRLVSLIATALVVAISVQAAAAMLGVLTGPSSPGARACVIGLAALVPVGLHLLTRIGGAPDDRDEHDDPWGRALALRSLAFAHLAWALAATAALGCAVAGPVLRADAPGALAACALVAAGLGGVAGVVAVVSARVEGDDAGSRFAVPAVTAGAVSVALAVAGAALAPAEGAGSNSTASMGVASTSPAAVLTATHFALAALGAVLLAVLLLAELRMPVRGSAGFSVSFAVLGFFMSYSAFGALSYALLGLASRRSWASFVEDPQPATMFRLIDFAAVVLTCAVLFVAARVVGRMRPLGASGELGVDAAVRTRQAVEAAPVELRRAGVGMLVAALALVLAELTRRALPGEGWVQRLATSITDPRMVMGAVGWLFVAYLVVRVCRGRPAALGVAVVVAAALGGLAWVLGRGGVDVLAWARLDTDLPGAGGIDHPSVAATSFTVIAVVTALFLPAAAVLWFIVSASGTRESRRSVGVLWDLTNFWPRLQHPWAPPPYTERAIPALTARVRDLRADHPHHAIVLSCHSQGAVLGFPVVRRLLANAARDAAAGEVALGARAGASADAGDLRSGAGVRPQAEEVMGAGGVSSGAEAGGVGPGTRADRAVRLLTYGNLLGAHYQQLFPRLFDDERLTEVASGMRGRWIQLFRTTDPLGHPLAMLGDACREASHVPPRGVDHVLTHASYGYSPEFQAALDYLGGARMPLEDRQSADDSDHPEHAEAEPAPQGWRRWRVRRP